MANQCWWFHSHENHRQEQQLIRCTQILKAKCQIHMYWYSLTSRIKKTLHRSTNCKAVSIGTQRKKNAEHQLHLFPSLLSLLVILHWDWRCSPKWLVIIPYLCRTGAVGSSFITYYPKEDSQIVAPPAIPWALLQLTEVYNSHCCRTNSAQGSRICSLQQTRYNDTKNTFPKDNKEHSWDAAVRRSTAQTG